MKISGIQNVNQAGSQNIYDEGYHTGAQISIFVGPIWIEEAVALQLQTSTNDQVVYPYSDPHYSRTLTGRYRMQGTLAIAYGESDYLLRVIEMAKDESITDSELQALVERRKSIFASTVKHNLMTSQYLNTRAFNLGGDTDSEELTRFATDYTERITREIELMSYRTAANGQRYLDPRTFEMTIVSGRIDGASQSIDIFEDVKVTGTSRNIVNDDQPQLEMYQLTARKKPDRVKKTTSVDVSKRYFIKDNLLAMASEITDLLLDDVLSPPVIHSFSTASRVSELSGSEKVAIAGHLNPYTRFYGDSASYIELVFGYEFPQWYPGIEKEAHSKTEVKILDGKDGDQIKDQNKTYLYPPNFTGSKYKFSNAYGRIVSVNREYSINGITAVAAVVPMPVSERVNSSSILSPRQKSTGFGVGSMIPPTLVDKELFSYDDDDLDDYTATVMWSNPLGFRGTAFTDSKEPENLYVEEEQGNFINEVVQPLYSYAYIDSISFDNEGDSYLMSISAPVYADFRNLHVKGNQYAKKIKGNQQIEHGKVKSEITITSENGVLSAEVTAIDGEDSPEYLKDMVLSVSVNTYNMSDIPKLSELEEPDFHLKQIAIDQVIGNGITSDYNKCVYLRPMIYVEVDNISEYIECGATMHTINGDYFDQEWMDYQKDTDFETAAYIGSSFPGGASGNGSSCIVNISYDFTVADISPLFSGTAGFTLNGAYFMYRDEDFETIVCPECGESINRELLFSDSGRLFRDIKVHVVWVAAIMPIDRGAADPAKKSTQGQTDSQKDSSNNVRITHDITSLSGRYAEIYNIIRCDTRMYDIIAMEDTGLIVGTLVGIWNSIKSIWAAIKNVELNDITNFTFPVKGNMTRVAGFCRSYACDIYIDEILTQLLECRIRGNLLGNIVGTKKDADWTLREALASSVPSGASSKEVSSADKGNNFTEETIVNLSAMVRHKLEDRLKGLPVKVISEDPETGKITVIRENITPMPSITAWSLTDEGYEELFDLSHAASTDSQYLIELGEYDT